MDERNGGATQSIAKLDFTGPVLLFDGLCNLCNGAVQFIIRRDKHARFRFAALQSEVGQTLLRRGAQGVGSGQRAGDVERLTAADRLDSRGQLDAHSRADTVVLLEAEVLFGKSTAVLRSVRYLAFPWPLLAVFLVIPRVLRDAVYDFIARHRYGWFGRRETCMMPTPELRDRFLSDDADRG